MDNNIKLLNYHKIRSKILPGDLISFYGKGIISAIIRWKTNSSDTHSAMVMAMLESDVGGNRLIITESLNKGPTVNYLSDRVEKYEGKVFWHHLYATDEQRIRLNHIAWDTLCKQTKYDYGSIFRQLLGNVFLDASHLFCSEMVQYYWQETGVIEKQKKALNPGQLIKKYIGKKIDHGIQIN